MDEDEESDEDNEAEEKDNGEIDDDFRNRVKTAMGKHAVNEDSDEASSNFVTCSFKLNERSNCEVFTFSRTLIWTTSMMKTLKK